MSDNPAILKKVSLLFLLTRVAIIFVTFLGLSALPHFEESDLYNPYGKMGYWIRWANWDGGHFRGIAENGYLEQQAVFFPFYPMLIKLLMYVGIPSLWGGLIISYFGAIIALFFFYKLVRLDFEEKVANQALLALLIFPTSLYLGAVYSESIFLALAIGAVYFARTQKWYFAFLLAALASITRLVGVAVIIAVFANYFFQYKPKFSFQYKNLIRLPIIFGIISLLPLIFYFVFLDKNFGDPFVFLQKYNDWDKQLTFPWDTPINAFDYLKQRNFFTIGETGGQIAEFFFFLIFFAGLIFSFFKLHFSYTVYFFLALLIPLLSGTLLSFPRYALVIFPMFILFGLVKNEYLIKFGTVVFILILSFYSILFINSYWVT